MVAQIHDSKKRSRAIDLNRFRRQKKKGDPKDQRQRVLLFPARRDPRRTCEHPTVERAVAGVAGIAGNAQHFDATHDYGHETCFHQGRAMSMGHFEALERLMCPIVGLKQNKEHKINHLNHLIVKVKRDKILDHFSSIVECTFGRRHSMRQRSLMSRSGRRSGS
jgi:hypothetical protein